MNENVEKLYVIGAKPTRHVIGLMSGTSLDGLDVALCAITGNGKQTSLTILEFTTVPYDDDYKKEVKTIFSKRNADLEKLCLLNEWIGIKHAAIINECLKKWKVSKETIDLIASHGQTVYHAPAHLHQDKKFGHGTLQIGDADHIAFNTGIITVSDFRQKHIAAGGEGAPLAAYGDFILFAEQENDVILLNIGGISNFTYLPAGASFKDITCSDIGPGNTLMDAYIQQHFPGQYFDEHAAVAKRGKVDEMLLLTLFKNDFFLLPYPKTTGPELFNLLYLENAVKEINLPHISHEDIMATLNQFTANCISETILAVLKSNDATPCKILVSGGGLHNVLLMDHLRQNLPALHISTTLDRRIPPDAKEAILFALLANECVSGNGKDFGEGTNHYHAVTMGKISFPN